MELREYWQIVWQRRRIIVPLVFITVVASAIVNLILPPTFRTETTVHVQAILPPPAANPYFSEEYYRTIHSEYLTDDLGVIVKSRVFAEKVAGHVESRYGQQIEPRDVVNSIASTKKLHRTLKITIASGSETLTKRLGDAIHEVLQTEGGRLLSRDDRQLVHVNVIDPPRDPTAPNPLRRMLDVLLHSAVALVAGTGLAFLLNALDDRVRDEADAAQTVGWPVLGAIPAARRADDLPGPQTATWLGTLLRPICRSARPVAAASKRALRNSAARRFGRRVERPRRLP